MASSSKGHKTKNYSLFCTSLTVFSHMSSWLSLLQLRTLSAHYREGIKPQPFVQSCKLRYIVKRKSVGSHQKAGRTYIRLRPQERRKQTRLKWFWLSPKSDVTHCRSSCPKTTAPSADALGSKPRSVSDQRKPPKEPPRRFFYDGLESGQRLTN